jgi:hypothetical protein
MGSFVRILRWNYVQRDTLRSMEVYLCHINRVDPLEDQRLLYARCDLPLGPTCWIDIVAAKQRSGKVVAILVRNAGLLLGTHILACRSLLRLKGR